jgi:chromatin remodeling complex protein RSC6
MPPSKSKAPKAPEEKPKKTSKTSKAATTTPVPVPESVPVKEAVKQEAVEVVENVVEDDVGKAFADLLQKLQMLTATFTAVKQDFKALEKRYMRELRAATKATDKKKKSANSKPRQPSGFVKPTKISTELANFLGKPEGSEMARTEVTREINKYIRANDLQDPSNGRKINPDGKLRGLLQVPTSDDLTYFNLQKYLSKHFPKSQATAPAAPVS